MMGRPCEQMNERLKRKNLLPSTRKTYTAIVRGAGTDDLLTWIRKKVHARTPVGTVLPMRAAVKHYLIAEKGYSEDEVDVLLPKASGRPAGVRQSLTAQQLAVYHAAVDEIDQDPAFTILSLLPSTGLRIGEITALHRDNVKTIDGRMYFVFRGKGDKERIVPLTRGAEEILNRYLNFFSRTGWLFLGYAGKPITPHAVRKYTRKIAAKYPDLIGLCPHKMRHTYATMMLRRGMNLVTLQQILGHSSIETTRRYLHPTLQDLRDGVDNADS